METIPLAAPTRETMNGKPILWRENVRTAINFDSDEFHEKKLCDGLTFNLGEACVFSCAFCYVDSMGWRTTPIIKAENERREAAGIGPALKFEDVVIRKRETDRKPPRDIIQILKDDLLDGKGRPRHNNPDDKRVIYSSTLVDVAANIELLKETAEACNLILQHTNWQIRLLSKSSFLNRMVKDKMIPEEYHQRLIFGFSTGTLDPELVNAIERDTHPIEARLKSLHWLQDNGFRTFGMICPSLPKERPKDYAEFSRLICDAIRVEKCEHVWAEVINVRKESLTRTLAALRGANKEKEAEMVAKVSTDANAWEKYSRATFEAHAKNIPPEKHRFLQYVGAGNEAWWGKRRDRGAVLLGDVAKTSGLNPLPVLPKYPRVLPPLAPADQQYLDEREQLVAAGHKASIIASKALHEIFTYGDGRLWKERYDSFEDYCRLKWGYQKQHGYRLNNCGGFVHDLELLPENKKYPIGYFLPAAEAHVRPVFDLPKENQVPFWTELAAKTPPAEMTAKVVKEAVVSFAEEKGIELKSMKKPRPPSDKKKAAIALEKLKAAIEVLDAKDKITGLLDKVEELIKGASTVK